MIKKQIDLKDLHSIIFLEKGHYDIWFLGGFGLQLKDFHIKIVDSENRIIQIKENLFKKQDFKNGKRAKKVFTFQIQKSDDFQLIINKSESVIVYKSNLVLAKFFSKRVENKELKILIEKD